MNFQLIIDQSKEEKITAVVHEASVLTAKIEEMVLKYNGTDKLPAYTEDEMKMLKFSEIECITVSAGKTYAIDRHKQTYRIKMRLYEIEAMLPSYFIRINKSSLANEHALERFRTSFSGAVDAVFKCGYTEYVSRRCFAEIKRRFKEK